MKMLEYVWIYMDEWMDECVQTRNLWMYACEIVCYMIE